MDALQQAVADVPPGAWAVAVSGGADSVALLHLLHQRPDLELHAVHLDHQTRGAASDADAAFVADLAARLGLAHTVVRLSEVESRRPEIRKNPSARYRAARLALFAEVVQAHRLRGAILAHHADDQAETVLQRLLRGNAPATLAGIRREMRVGNVLLVHPLLPIPRSVLRDWLRARNIAWREDASNASPLYQRNRLRRLLEGRPALTGELNALASACATWADWLDETAPPLGARFPVTALQDVPDPLAHHAARRWLLEAGAPAEEVGRDVVVRLVDMARDAASPPRQSFPANLVVRRRRGEMFADPATGA